MVTINEVGMRLWRSVICNRDGPEVISLDVHRELAIPDEIHEALWDVIFLLIIILVSLGIVFRIVPLLQVWRIRAGENIYKTDHEPCDALILLFLLQHLLS